MKKRRVLTVILSLGLAIQLGASLVLLLGAGPPLSTAAPLAAWPYPGAKDTAVLDQMDYTGSMEQAQSVNPDVVGWLCLPGTDIDGPVLQTSDNAYYLRRDLAGQYNEWGSYFVDYECSLAPQQSMSRVTVIYGHSWQDDPDEAYFSQVKRYEEPGFARAYPYVAFQVAGQPPSCWQVFAAGRLPVDFPYTLPNPGEEDYALLLATLRDASTQNFGPIDVAADDKILILSTCTVNTDMRYVLAAKQA